MHVFRCLLRAEYDTEFPGDRVTGSREKPTVNPGNSGKAVIAHIPWAIPLAHQEKF